VDGIKIGDMKYEMIGNVIEMRQQMVKGGKCSADIKVEGQYKFYIPVSEEFFNNSKATDKRVKVTIETIE